MMREYFGLLTVVAKTKNGKEFGRIFLFHLDKSIIPF